MLLTFVPSLPYKSLEIGDMHKINIYLINARYTVREQLSILQLPHSLEGLYFPSSIYIEQTLSVNTRL